MIQHSAEEYGSFKLFTTLVGSQLYTSVSVSSDEGNPEAIITQIYEKIAAKIAEVSGQIVQERCFGNVDVYKTLTGIRVKIFQIFSIDHATPVTFVEGEPCGESTFAGIQIRAIIPDSKTQVWTINDGSEPKGRAWNLSGSIFYIFHNIDGGKPAGTDRRNQSEAMFNQADEFLRNEGASFHDVVRTWIFLSDILDWYGDFNKVRNNCFTGYGFLGNGEREKEAEKLYLPASTGIEGRNPAGRAATMDVFAIHRTPDSLIQVRPIYGIKQQSPHRYGSAFSRAAVVEEKTSKLILVSGTASIDEEGNSVFLGDVEAQIRHTFNVISSLIAPEGAALKDLCEATVFLKRKEDFPIFRKVIEEMGISNLPSINVVADVCRDELLFEIDAAFVIENTVTKAE
ncbi:MAG: hypothetical protein JXA06_11715 [Bacteroidetes bacterium]|nr:hypothetical protein [Bacteroidota bacterium]